MCKAMCKLLCSDRTPPVPTNLAIDDRLLEKARRVGRHRTKKATVTEALEEYIRRRERLCILDLLGAIEFDSRYDYKAARKKR